MVRVVSGAWLGGWLVGGLVGGGLVGGGWSCPTLVP